MGLISRVSSRTYRSNYEKMEADFLPYEPVRKKSKSNENHNHSNENNNIAGSSETNKTKNKLLDLRELINKARNSKQNNQNIKKSESEKSEDFVSYDSDEDEVEVDSEVDAILSLGEESYSENHKSNQSEDEVIEIPYEPD